jgi:hypothetical protein
MKRNLFFKNRKNQTAEMDDFDREALEGWNSTGADVEILKKLDKRFVSKSYGMYFVIGTVVVLSLAAVFLLKNNPNIQVKDSPSLSIVDKADTIFPLAVDTLSELTIQKQITVKTLKKSFSSINQQESAEKNNVNPSSNSVLDPLVPRDPQPLKTNPEISREKPELEVRLAKKSAKEIYAYDLKLIDYREYRSKNTIQTEQLDLTGTPANLSGKSENLENTQWVQVQIPYYDYIKQTMQQFSKGKFKSSLTRCLHILETYPDDLNAQFYGGLSAFNLKNFDQAIALLSKASQHPFANFNQESTWYLAQAYDLSGNKEKANNLYAEIISQKGYYAVQAKNKLNK